VVRAHIEHQEAGAIFRDEPIVNAVVSDAGNARTFAFGSDDSGYGLLARIETRRTDRKIGYAACRQAIGVKLVNRDAVRATLTDEETTVDAIQRPDLVSILAGG
jgi:hypothetical protein